MNNKKFSAASARAFKKGYAKPQMKIVKLKQRASLLSSSDPDDIDIIINR